MRTGRMRFVGDIQREVVTGKDARGQPVKQWHAFATEVPMEIEPLSGKQLEIWRQLTATVDYSITFRNVDGVTPGMRVVFEGRYFVADYVNEVDLRRNKMQLICTEQKTGATNG